MFNEFTVCVETYSQNHWFCWLVTAGICHNIMLAKKMFNQGYSNVVLVAMSKYNIIKHNNA